MRDAHRRPGVLATQQQVLLRLMLAGVVLFVVVFGAAYLYLVPLGLRSVRAVVPEVTHFMDAGAQNDVSSATALFSRTAIRRGAGTDVSALFAERRLFQDYRGLRVTRFEMAGGDGEAEVAAVEAAIQYATVPSGQLYALMVIEEDRWRFETVRVTR